MIKAHPSKLVTRRRLLRTAVAGALMHAHAMPAFRVWGNEQEFYQGPLLITLQLDGGADVTQLCDPKVNTPGEPAINHWADTSDPGQAGNLLYAPIADNQRLFERFGLDTLVVNGVDSQTNSHETGRIYNWTGSNAEGKPSLAALHAAYQSPEQPLAYAVYGGVSRTAGIISYNRFANLESLRTLALPGIDSWSGDRRRPEAEDGGDKRMRSWLAMSPACWLNPGMSTRESGSVWRASLRPVNVEVIWRFWVTSFRHRTISIVMRPRKNLIAEGARLSGATSSNKCRVPCWFASRALARRRICL